MPQVKKRGRVRFPDGEVDGAVFNRDKTKILTWSKDKTVRLWEVRIGSPVGLPMTHNSHVKDAVFNRDETKILTWSGDCTVRLWETGTGKPIGPPMTHDDDINDAVFNRDETRILTWSDDGTARLWDIGVDYDFPVDLLKLQIAAITGTEFDPATGEITCIEPERWEKMKARYLEKASQHYKSCKYKNANIFHRFYPDKKIEPTEHTEDAEK